MPSRGRQMEGQHVPRGYLFSVAAAGIRYQGRSDMALIHSEREATVAATFTTNRVKAAPVICDMKRVRSGKGRTIVVNSGNANACTGDRGLRDAEAICREVAVRLDVPERSVLIASTGVIGTPLPMERVMRGVDGLIRSLGKAGPWDVARAMMTTDSFPKVVSRRGGSGATEFTVTGIAKGAGMISPEMATMLCFILTDLAVGRTVLKAALAEAVAKTFNLTTVDGEMSTNDTVIAMANGAAGNRPPAGGSPLLRRLKAMLLEVTDELSRMIARDGEGATRLLIVKVRGARSQRDARRAALSVAESPLVKTAVHGGDPNWGRIMAALGHSGAALREHSVEIAINGVKVVKAGLGTEREREASEAMAGEEVVIDIDLKRGGYSERVYSCDLTEEYVRINARYRT